MTEKKTILITGGSGFIGTKIADALLLKGYYVLIVDIHEPVFKHEHLTFLPLDLSAQKLPKEYDGKIEGVINLAGKNIFGKWTDSFKKELLDSRIMSTRNLVESLSLWSKKPEVLISASAFGYYGNKGESSVSETAFSGHDFGSDLCLLWEKEALEATRFSIRTVQIRTANVLGEGGFLKELSKPFLYRLAFYVGDGEGYLPWIHIDDIVSLYLFALEHKDVSGPINGGAPQFVTQKELVKSLARLMNISLVFSIPVSVFQFYYGDFALTFNSSVKLETKKVENLGFVFKYKEIEEALQSLAQGSPHKSI